MTCSTCETLPPAGELLLAEGGKSDWRIVVGKAPSVYEKKAARLLQLYFLRAAEAYLPIVTDAEPAADCEIVIGRTDRDPLSGIPPRKPLTPHLPDYDSYRITANGCRIFLDCAGDRENGEKNRGAVYAAYRFIEEFLHFDILYDQINNDYRDLTLDRVTVPVDTHIESSARTLWAGNIPAYPGETVMYMLPQVDLATQIGTGVLFKTADGKILLIDGGYAGELENLAAAVKAVTPAGQRPRVDAWLITHLHEDHFDALLRYLDTVERGGDAGFDLGEIWGHVLSSAWYEGQGLGSYAGRAERLKNPPAGIGYTELNRGDCFAFGAARMEVLWTGREDVRCNMNDSSVVMRVTADGKRILLLADAEGVAGEALLRECAPEQLAADAVQIGHHGTFNVPKAVYARAGATDYFWPITYRWWYCDDGTGLGTINKQYGTLAAMSKTRLWLEQLKVPREKIYRSYVGTAVYRFAEGQAMFLP